MAVLFFAPIRSHAVARIALSPFEKRINKKINFDNTDIWLPASMHFGSVSIIDENGQLYYFDKVNIFYDLVDLIFKGEFRFNMEGVKLYKKIELLNSVADILVISKMPDVEFSQIKGTLRLRKNSIFIKDIYAHNDKMRIRGNGWVDNSGSLESNINFSFSKDVTDKIPSAVRIALLKNEESGWMGIMFKTQGNYKKPSLHISSKSIKLNIREIPAQIQK